MSISQILFVYTFCVSAACKYDVWWKNIIGLPDFFFQTDVMIARRVFGPWNHNIINTFVPLVSHFASFKGESSFHNLNVIRRHSRRLVISTIRCQLLNRDQIWTSLLVMTVLMSSEELPDIAFAEWENNRHVGTLRMI